MIMIFLYYYMHIFVICVNFKNHMKIRDILKLKMSNLNIKLSNIEPFWCKTHTKNSNLFYKKRTSAYIFNVHSWCLFRILKMSGPEVDVEIKSKRQYIFIALGTTELHGGRMKETYPRTRHYLLTHVLYVCIILKSKNSKIYFGRNMQQSFKS